MIARLREPGGVVGGLSIAAAVLLGLIGAIGVVALVISLGTGSTFWSETATDKLWAIGFFTIMLLGAAGFVVMDRAPMAGGALGVLGGLAFAVPVWWAILPLLLGLAIAVLAVWRARLLHAGGHAVPSTA